jgi:hypothetical protein
MLLISVCVCALPKFPPQVISLEEFREGCRLLNRNLHPDYQLTNVEHTLKLMDFDGSGTIDINEFFEVLHEYIYRTLFCNLCALKYDISFPR